MLWSRRRGPRRMEIRKNRPDAFQRGRWWVEFRASGAAASLGVAAGFCLIATLMVVVLREDVVSWRAGQYTPTDIVSRVKFSYADRDKLADAQRVAREIEPRVYTQVGEPWNRLEEQLLSLPSRV